MLGGMQEQNSTHPVQPGDPVVVLHWRGIAEPPAMRVRLVSRFDPYSGDACIRVGPTLTFWADSWRAPTTDELAAYQLDQLQAGGL